MSEVPTTVEFPEALPARRRRGDWYVETDGVEVKLSNLDKPYWVPEGFTKADLVAYYWNAAAWALPYVADRPLTMKRMPDGADGGFFYAKQAPEHTPGWVRTAAVRSRDVGKTIDYVVAGDRATLVWLANLGCIELHPWHSRADEIGRPDYAFFDLDPFGADFATVRAVALVVRTALDHLGLRGYPRTSGATGMQVYVPIERVHSHAGVRTFVRRVCQLIRDADPGRTTMAHEISQRTGKVYLDYGMNTEGRNIAATYCLRPERGAPVATPLTWDEVDSDVEPQDFTIASIWDRLEQVGDIFTPVLQGGQDLRAAMRAVGLDPEGVERARGHDVLTVGPFSGAAAEAAIGAGARGAAGPQGASRDAEDAAGGEGASRDAEDAGGEGAAGGVEDAAAGDQAEGADGAAPAGDTASGRLERYRRMRDFSRTPEPPPEGGAPGADQPRFVLQHHLATRLHHDLRLERDGVAASWALPKGLPDVRGPRRLAVQTEDHPLSYMTFSGEIPEGEYGGGPVRIWDSGHYEALEWIEGKVTFRLHGTRHQGEYHLFRTGRDGDQWLVVRADEPAEGELPPGPPELQPMLATSWERAFDDEDWVFEVKWDGVRVLATCERPGVADDGRTVLHSRQGNDVSAAYPELASLWERVVARNAVLDGEIVATDERGRPSFQRLQRRMHLRGRDAVQRARTQLPVTLMVFDLLAVDGEAVTELPLTERLALLDEVFVPSRHARRSDVFRGDGVALYEAAVEQGLEGIVAKLASSPYRPGRRSREWRKIKVRRQAEVVIGGWLPGEGGRAGRLGALLVGAYDGDALRFLGRVGTGFDEHALADLGRRLSAIATGVDPFADAPRLRQAHWVEPSLVCCAEFSEVTDEQRLRAPAYKGLREGTDPRDCLLDELT